MKRRSLLVIDENLKVGEQKRENHWSRASHDRSNADTHVNGNTKRALLSHDNFPRVL